jgi:HSP20 family protein
MDYIKIRLRGDLDKLLPGIDKTIDQMLQPMSPMFSLSKQTFKPLMDLYETPDEIIILAAVAGVEKEELELEVNTRAIRISGCRGTAFADKNLRYCLAEMQLGPFERVLILPSPINTGEVSATYSNGLLQVRMSKLQIDKTRRIRIVER